ncbi:MAG TPA: hypothetical protein VF338_08750, partial [Leptolinea sp.]
TVPSGFDNWFKPENLVLIILLISCLPAGMSLLIPKKYPLVQSADTLKILEANYSTFHFPLPFARIKEFASTDNAAVYQGKAMFPRWMKTGTGDSSGSGSAFSALSFDHLSFSMLSRTKYPFDVVLPINEQVSFLPNSSEVIVIGCQTNSYFDAAFVFVLSPQIKVYARPGLDKLTCPFPQP